MPKRNSMKKSMKNSIKSKTKVNIRNDKDFKPNLTPPQILKMGSFGGTYFRDIHSSVTNKNYKGKTVIRKYPKSWFKNIDIDKYIVSSKYDKNINKYKVKCGSSLESWETSGWIHKQDPYGWFQWFCHYYLGRRTPDDVRQIERWKKLAGPNGRFRKRLINLVKQRRKTYDDPSVSPVIRQVLHHWGYRLTPNDVK